MSQTSASPVQEVVNGKGMRSSAQIPSSLISGPRQQSREEEVSHTEKKSLPMESSTSDRAAAVQNMLDFLEGEDEEESSTRARDRGESVSAAKRNLYVTTEQVPVPSVPDNETSKNSEHFT